MIVKIVGMNQTYYFEGNQIYKEGFKSQEELKGYGAYRIVEENSNTTYALVTIFEEGIGNKQVVTNCLTFLMNNDGKTIDRLN